MTEQEPKDNGEGELSLIERITKLLNWYKENREGSNDETEFDLEQMGRLERILYHLLGKGDEEEE